MTALLTSSPPDVRLGVPRPRVVNVPEGIVRTLGPEVRDFMRMVGKPLLPWQEYVCDVAFGIRADGKWAAYEVAIWLARQNGKGVVTEAQELFGAYMLREKKVIHSAHEFDTAGEAFDRLVEIIEGSDWLSKRTNKIVRGKGSEGIELTRPMGGGEIRFKARTDRGARGFTGDRIILDEAFALTVAEFKAMSPTLATIPNPQITYTSSPPDEKTGPMPEDAMAPSIRKRALSGDAPRLASFEWSPTPKSRAGDVDEWYRCNPSLGTLIDEEYLALQYGIFEAANKTAGFSTEHLGKWEEGTSQWLVIPEDDWTDAGVDDDVRPQYPALAVVLSTDRQWATICVAGRRPDGLLQVEIADRRQGTGWVLPRLQGLIERWQPVAVVIDGGSPAASLEAEAVEAKIELTPISVREVAAAAGALYDGIAGRPAMDPDTGEPGPDPRVVRHRKQADLTTAVAGAVKRKLSTSWAWDQLAAEADITPLIGCSNALLAHKTREPTPVFFATVRTR